jgi:hypothetical protein
MILAGYRFVKPATSAAFALALTSRVSRVFNETMKKRHAGARPCVRKADRNKIAGEQIEEEGQHRRRALNAEPQAIAFESGR